MTTGFTETVYLVELCFRNDIVAGQTSCTQIKVWRTTNDKHQSAVADLPRHFSAGCWIPIILWLPMKNKPVTEGVLGSDDFMGIGRRFYVYASDGGEPERPLFVIQDMESFLNIGVIFVGE